MLNITVEPLHSEDYARVAYWLGRPETNRWLASAWRVREVDEKLIAIVAMNPRQRLYLARCDKQPTGIVTLACIDLIDHHAMLWYALGATELGCRGVMTEAVRQVIRVGFDELGLRSISASIIEGNIPSQKVLESNSFHRVGVLRFGLTLDGQHVHRIIYDLIPEDLGLVYSTGNSKKRQSVR